MRWTRPGLVVRMLRESRGFSIEELARLANVEASLLALLEGGKICRLDTSCWEGLAKVFGVRAESLSDIGNNLVLAAGSEAEWLVNATTTARHQIDNEMPKKPIDPWSLGSELRTYLEGTREERHWSRQRLAVESQINIDTIGRIESGKMRDEDLTEELVAKLAAALWIPLPWLRAICGFGRE